jgi:hypothetical protein
MATAVTAARHICLSASRFRDLVAAGVFKRMPAGKYDLRTIREAYCLHMQKIAQGRAADGGAALSTQRARLADALANAAEFKNAQSMGGFVSLPLFQKHFEDDLIVLRERALSTPGKIADGLQPFTPLDRAAIHDVVRGEIFEMLDDMANPPAYVAKVVARQAAGQKETR